MKNAKYVDRPLFVFDLGKFVSVRVCFIYTFSESGYYPHGHVTIGDLTTIIFSLYCKLFQLERDFP